MPKTPILDTELADLAPEVRWREWMGRIEAVIFASATPVPREDLARLVGQGVPVDPLIEDIRAELRARPYDLVAVATGWMFRTRPRYAKAIHTAADVEDQTMGLAEFDVAVLAAIAYHQPLTREGLRDIFGREISRDVIARLRLRDLVAHGPRSPKPGAPHTYVTTETFLIAFDLQSLRDLPDSAQPKEDSPNQG